jgi:hypothetical protein
MPSREVAIRCASRHGREPPRTHRTQIVQRCQIIKMLSTCGKIMRPGLAGSMFVIGAVVLCVALSHPAKADATAEARALVERLVLDRAASIAGQGLGLVASGFGL